MAEDTGVTPLALAEKPGLSPGGRSILQAYDILDQARQYSSIGPQSIQVAEVLAYIEIARIDAVEDRLLFLNTIKTLDVIYLNHCAEQQKK